MPLGQTKTIPRCAMKALFSSGAGSDLQEGAKHMARKLSEPAAAPLTGCVDQVTISTSTPALRRPTTTLT
jgi:hypothetical protein